MLLILVGTFNQEKALVGAFSVIVKTGCGTDGALHSTKQVRPSTLLSLQKSDLLLLHLLGGGRGC